MAPEQQVGEYLGLYCDAATGPALLGYLGHFNVCLRRNNRPHQLWFISGYQDFYFLSFTIIDPMLSWQPRCTRGSTRLDGVLGAPVELKCVGVLVILRAKFHVVLSLLTVLKIKILLLV